MTAVSCLGNIAADEAHAEAVVHSDAVRKIVAVRTRGGGCHVQRKRTRSLRCAAVTHVCVEAGAPVCTRVHVAVPVALQVLGTSASHELRCECAWALVSVVGRTPAPPLYQVSRGLRCFPPDTTHLMTRLMPLWLCVAGLQLVDALPGLAVALALGDTDVVAGVCDALAHLTAASGDVIQVCARWQGNLAPMTCATLTCCAARTSVLPERLCLRLACFEGGG